MPKRLFKPEVGSVPDAKRFVSTNRVASGEGHLVSIQARVFHNEGVCAVLNAGGVEGLVYIPNLLSRDKEKELLSLIGSQEWSTALKRRVQQYGFLYDYQARSVLDMERGQDLPDWSEGVVTSLRELLCELGLQNLVHLWPTPNQMIVNEYTPGQGISAHVDKDIFEDVIVSVSLGSDVGMEFSPCPALLKERPSEQPVLVLLERGSAIILTGASRSLWKHGIRPRKTDRGALKMVFQRSLEGEDFVVTKPVLVQRERRISITFRVLRQKDLPSVSSKQREEN